MNKAISMIILGVTTIAIAGCATGRFHDSPMPDPEPYRICFQELDTAGEGKVSWEMFKDRFGDDSREVFTAIDQSADGHIDHGEWHRFEHAHGHE